MNCWDFKKCGFTESGAQGKQCPAYPSHGKHCARVPGTRCGGCMQGRYVEKLSMCIKCDFYHSEHYDRSYSDFSPLTGS